MDMELDLDLDLHMDMDMNMDKDMNMDMDMDMDILAEMKSGIPVFIPLMLSLYSACNLAGWTLDS